MSHLFKDVVGRVECFAMCDDEVKMDICFKLKSIYRMADRVVTTAGEVPTAMYVIRFGTVNVRGVHGRVRRMRTGELFGEMAILGLTVDGKRCRSVTALSVCELCELSKEDFQDLLTSNPSFFNIIRQASRVHTDMLREMILHKGAVHEELGDIHSMVTHMNWPAIKEEMSVSFEGEKIRKAASKIAKESISAAETKMRGMPLPLPLPLSVSVPVPVLVPVPVPVPAHVPVSVPVSACMLH